MPVYEGKDTAPEWFAIRVTYSRELMVQNYLNGCRIENYIPMHEVESSRNGRQRKVMKPMIHNLIFVRTPAERLKQLKAESGLPIRYIMNRETRSPMVIPDRQMEDFMAVVATRNEHVEIVAPETVAFKPGDRVRVTGGPFMGIEGRYIRHKGHSKVAVEIRNIATVLTAYVPLNHIEKI